MGFFSWGNSEPEPYEFWALATYNAERARGIVHTKEWDEKMAAEQARFDAQPHPSGATPAWLAEHLADWPKAG